MGKSFFYVVILFIFHLLIYWEISVFSNLIPKYILHLKKFFHFIISFNVLCFQQMFLDIPAHKHQLFSI